MYQEQLVGAIQFSFATDRLCTVDERQLDLLHLPLHCTLTRQGLSTNSFVYAIGVEEMIIS